jgi:HAD superfamily hydrolase (TIGR01490 family)
MLDPATVADKALRSYRGKPERWMIERCDAWFAEYVVPHVAEAGQLAVKRHTEQGDVVAIVTGATPYAARPLARMLGIEHVVSSELEVDAAGCFTGRARPPLCFGIGKRARAEKFVREAGGSLKDSVFYTDSITDLPLLDEVGERVAVNPDPRLRRIAQRRGWPVERW